jgi:hypothetical protein
MESNIILPEHWNYGEEGFVVISKRYGNPSTLDWIGIVTGVIGLSFPGNPYSVTVGTIGLLTGIAGGVYVTSFYYLETDQGQKYHGYPPIPTPWGSD